MWTLAGVLPLLACVSAVTRDQFYAYGNGVDQRLPKGEQAASPEVPLKVPVVFYGEVYESIFINNHGVLSFRADIPSFLNIEFPLPYPSIAAFYSRIDTSQSGAVYYRETNDYYSLRKAEQNVQDNFHDYYDFKPNSVFIATWADVTYSNPQQEKTPQNTFQIALISNGTETFVEFLYPERDIQWIQREEQPPSLPDAKAQAGFIAEDGRVFTLRGSGSDHIRSIVTWTNTDEPGKYVFRVGDILYDDNVAVPDRYNQTEVEIDEESKTCAQSGSRVCHIQAKCEDYQAGLCCKCNDGYYGTGKSCIKADVPLRVHGKVNGIINTVNLNDVDIQAYVVVADGRSYTALSQAPANLGNSLQLLNILGSVIGWLFAQPFPGTKNGYQLTGGLFNHTADVYFPATKDRVMINQEFWGHDVFDQIILDSDIRGTIPYLPMGTKLDIMEFEDHLTLDDSGILRSESTRIFTNKATNQRYEQVVTQTFTFTPACRYAPTSSEDTTPITMKATKNYLGFEERDNIVRYGSSNKIMILGQDPCLEGRNLCPTHSACVPQDGTFSCVCQPGYTSDYSQYSQVCIDVNECIAGTHNCDNNADCYNHEGGFQCRCREGYEGNGVNCHQSIRCTSVTCDPNAQCIETPKREPECVCNEGFVGDGKLCINIDVRECSHCDTYASCVVSESGTNYVCQCNPGYIGNGYSCTPYVQATTVSETDDMTQISRSTVPPTQSQITDTSSSETVTEADYSIIPATCNIDGICSCFAGYSIYVDEYNNQLCHRDSYSDPEPVPDNNDTTIRCKSDAQCPPNAVCITDQSFESYFNAPDNNGHCACLEGYEGDGLECIERTGSCDCGSNAHCIETVIGEVMCACNPGFHGDGFSCKPNGICGNNSDCETNAECKFDAFNNVMVCQCRDGYIKDSDENCILEITDCNGAVCPENSSCLYDQKENIRYCQCNPGFEGDVIQCTPIVPTCEVTRDCSFDAVCTLVENKYQCVCREGFTGDGYVCTPEMDCRIDPYMCDPHSSCLKRNNEYLCECNNGYNGNGSYCELNPRKAGNFLAVCDGASVYKVPFQPSRTNFATPINSAIYQTAVGIDVDCLTGKIYWGDVNGYSIKRSAYDGSSYEQFLSSGIKSPEGIAIDWAGRNIYWTDSKKITIEVANIDTKVRKVLFSGNGITNPRGIAVHPQRGKIFWTDWNRIKPKIEWANMDGTQRGIFLDDTEVRLPNSLAIDWARDRLCYTDAGLYVVKCVNINNLEKEIIASNCSYPFGLAINGDNFYWTDWKSLKIESMNTATRQRSQVPMSSTSRRLFGLAVAPDGCPALNNVCQYRNGNCDPAQLCLPDGRGGKTCVEGESGY